MSKAREQAEVCGIVLVLYMFAILVGMGSNVHRAMRVHNYA